MDAKDLLVDVWEVYERDSQNSVAYLNENDARNSTFYDEVDLITQSKILVNKDELKILKSGKPLF